MEENGKPKIGMEFDNLDDTWSFWKAYGGKIGFRVRKDTHAKSKKNKTTITSVRYVCSKEGFCESDRKGANIKNPRVKTRTGCMARLALKLSGVKYKVYQFIEEHNHALHTEETSHMLSLQRKITKAQAYEIELVEAQEVKAGVIFGEDPMLDITHRFRELGQEAISIVSEAARSTEASLVMRDLMAEMSKKVNMVLHSTGKNVDTNLGAVVPTPQCTSHATKLKQKEGAKNKRQFKSCVEVQRKKRVPTRVNEAQGGVSCSASLAPQVPTDHSVSSFEALQFGLDFSQTDY